MHGSGAVSCSCSLLIRGPILPAVRQKLHLSPCADSRSRLSKAPGGEAGSGGGLGQAAMMGKNRTMIYGPKDDGTYVVEFRTAAGEALAISIPKTEAAVVRLSKSGCPTGFLCRI